MNAPDGGADLSGRWHGFYNLPVDEPPTLFEAELLDTGGLLSGETTEEGDTPDCFGMTLHAVIEGRREGERVVFTKRYDYLPRADYAIDYEGMLAPGGDEIVYLQRHRLLAREARQAEVDIAISEAAGAIVPLLRAGQRGCRG